MMKVIGILRKFARFLAAAFFIFAGTMHFLKPGPFVEIMPDILPFPLFLVYLSGVLEIVGGSGLLTSRWHRQASWGLIALLIAVFPANLNMAINSIDLGLPHYLLWWRLPFQLVFIAWVWWCARD